MKSLNSYIKNKKATMVVLILASTFLLLNFSKAAELKFQPERIMAGRGSIVPVAIFLDALDAEINAVQLSVNYPLNILKFKNSNDGNSIISFWIEKPKAENGRVSFSGIVPGGYQKENGLLVVLNFEATEDGDGKIGINPQSQLLLNDSLGTPIKFLAAEAAVKITASLPATKPEISDQNPPEDFSIKLSHDEDVFDGKYFIAFTTQDKGSGISHYEVGESGGFFKRNPDNWQAANSPHLLRDQGLKSWIFVRATDYGGNERIAFLRPTNNWIYNHRYPLTILSFLLVILAVVLIRRKHSSV